ncbi:MAG TPA: immunoglobulin domain-containing protein, partial [Candidatus Limnocylindrales bacterium]|nr:immunoglobulin domain-containing protein [Candidatus Limnocylindrales bacterium]
VVAVGQSTNLSVGISACPPLSYQWYFNATNLLTAGTNATLELNNVTEADGGEYLVVVSNASGSVTSAPAVLTVVVPATILTPPADQAATNGETVLFVVIAEGTEPLSYKWYFNETNELAGAIGPTLMLNSVTTEQAGTYRVVITNPYGTATAAARLSVNETAAIISGPASLTVTNGATAMFTVTAVGTPPISYQWFFNSTNQLEGATSSTLTLANVTVADMGTYSVVISNPFGSVLSQAASLRVLVAPQLVSLTRNQNVVSLTFSTVNGLLYSVYYVDEISSTNWILLPKETGLLGTGSPITVQDPKATGALRFYRVVVE